MNLYDSERVIQAFTVQHHAVAKRLESGEVHRQSWLRSAAYTGTPGDPTGLLHRRAYFWMASQYAKRMNRRLRSAPVWISFTVERAFAGVKASETEVVLELSIPALEILQSQYYRSPSEKWERVLYGVPCCRHESGETCHHVLTCHGIRATWETLFDLTGGPTDWQGIVDRIEPHWLVARLTSEPIIPRA